jgi:hypothetical protein
MRALTKAGSYIVVFTYRTTGDCAYPGSAGGATVTVIVS